jgi:hypothetical protein
MESASFFTCCNSALACCSTPPLPTLSRFPRVARFTEAFETGDVEWITTVPYCYSVVYICSRLNAAVRLATLAQRIHGQLCLAHPPPGFTGVEPVKWIIFPSVIVFPLFLNAVLFASAITGVNKGCASRIAAWTFWSVWRMKLPITRCYESIAGAGTQGRIRPVWCSRSADRTRP